jgi:hypothetical protein
MYKFSKSYSYQPPNNLPELIYDFSALEYFSHVELYDDDLTISVHSSLILCVEALKDFFITYLPQVVFNSVKVNFVDSEGAVFPENLTPEEVLLLQKHSIEETDPQYKNNPWWSICETYFQLKKTTDLKDLIILLDLTLLQFISAGTSATSCIANFLAFPKVFLTFCKAT